jgi:ribosome-binding protein aMBF1 (putative translation factor)
MARSSSTSACRAAAARIAYAATTSEGATRAKIPDVWTIHENRRRSTSLVMNSERVRELREEKGMTRRDLAAAAGISVKTVRRVEREKPVMFRTGRAVADALGIEPGPRRGRVLGRV